MTHATRLPWKRSIHAGPALALLSVLALVACGRPRSQPGPTDPRQREPDLLGESVVDLGASATSVCGDDDAIFAAVSDGRIVRIDPGSGSVTTAYTAPPGYFARALACTRDRVVFEQYKQFVEDGCAGTPGCGLSIESMPRAGGPPEELLSGSHVMRLAIDVEAIYWTETSPLYQPSEPWKLRAMPLAGGPARDLFAATWIEWSFAIDATSVWLLASTDAAPRQGGMFRVPKDGGAAVPFGPVGLPLSVEGGALLVAARDGSETLGRSAPIGSPPSPLHPLTPSPYGDYGVSVGDGGVYILLVDALILDPCIGDCGPPGPTGGDARVVHVKYDGSETVLARYTDSSGMKGPALLTERWFYWFTFGSSRLVRAPRVADPRP